MNFLYHNPKCSKSRAALTYLQSTNIEFKIIEYLKTPLNKQQISKLCEKLDIKPFKLIRTKDQLYKDLIGQTHQCKTNDDWLNLLVEYPKLIERPIFETDTSAAIGRPLENIKAII